MDVKKRSLTEVFNHPTRLEAPLFQRPYVWNKEDNWEPLWDSIRELADRQVERQAVRPHFLGTIVLEQLLTPTGSVNKRRIIDGQQRLTTLQLVLAAARDLCSAENVKGYPEEFSELTTNRTHLSPTPEDVFKVWPTNVDRRAFRTVMSAKSWDRVMEVVAALAAEKHSTLIPEAYLFFYRTFADWLGEPKGETSFDVRLRALYETLTSQLNLVVIDLDEKDDAQVIFETLNALGTPLLPADLVKNYLFHSAHLKEPDTQDLYDRFWKTFDDDQKFWRVPVVRGRLKRPQIDVFLHDYLNLMAGDFVSAPHLFAEFRKLVEQERPDLSAVDHLKQFHTYAAVYRQLKSFAEDTREGMFFKRLDVMNSETVLPLLLELFRRNACAEGRHEILTIIGDLESFLVRRMVCGLTTQSYTRFFAATISKLRKEDAFTAAAIRRLLLEQSAEASRWPDDAEFGKSWVTRPMYGRLSQARVQMILRTLNDAMRDSREETIRVIDKLTIEHLLPQDWPSYWPLPNTRVVNGQEVSLTKEEAVSRRSDLVHTAGNLTLLTKSLNPSVSNRAWLTKKTAILQHSALTLNRRLHDVDTWGEPQIENRTKDLLAIAIRVWPHPASITP